MRKTCNNIFILTSKAPDLELSKEEFITAIFGISLGDNVSIEGSDAESYVRYAVSLAYVGWYAGMPCLGHPEPTMGIPRLRTELCQYRRYSGILATLAGMPAVCIPTLGIPIVACIGMPTQLQVCPASCSTMSQTLVACNGPSLDVPFRLEICPAEWSGM